METVARHARLIAPTAALAAVLTVCAGLSAAGAEDGVTPTPTSSSAPSPTTSASPSSSPTGTPSSSVTGAPSSSATGTPSGTASATATATTASPSEPPVTEPVSDAVPVLAAAPALAQLPVTLPPIEFTIATFNVLGANHRRGGFARGKMAAGLVRQHQIDVVGLQEMQRDNLRGFTQVLPASKFSYYPGPGARTLDNENAIAWKNARFRLVSGQQLTIPYFHGQPRRMPLVLLEHVATGRRIYVANFHNPATTRRHGNNERWRDKATAMQIQLVKRLTSQHHYPVYFTGDFNEHEEYFCRLTGTTQMISASGGSNDGRCVVPRPSSVDLIFGSKRKGVVFQAFIRDTSRQVRRTTDHPLVVARSAVAPLVVQ